jgi:pseudaminic acid cytidylyltransferase
MRVAVIPARGGSKRIPRKNIRSFCGKPMISWPITAALASECFDRIIVSTDDEEIAATARKFGAEVPFARPANLAGDHTPTIPVISHAIEWLLKHDEAPQHVCCIYATAPFLSVDDLRTGLALIEQKSLDYVFSAARFSFPIQRALRMRADGRVSMFHPEQFNTRSQDLEEAFHDAGQFYWGRADAWTAGLPIFTASSAIVQLPSWRVQDIDTEEDWIRAEKIFSANEHNGGRP